MSLFKVREFWAVDLNIPDAFDGNSLLVDNVGTRSFIFLGSHDGFLRAYSPAGKEPSEYKASDLVYETLFPSPVLQMGMACLVSGSSSKQLAVLHPKALAVYAINQSETDGDSLLSLKHVYQHSLSRAAYSFVAGSFGRVRGRDFICVQSLDGLLSFFEQETSTFEAQLPDFLLPASFRYIDTIDAFLFQDANQYFTCYTYEELSQTNRRAPKPCWTHNIGEYILDLSIIYLGEEVNIFILTERNFYNLNELGKITWMKRFEFQPICFYSFVNKYSKKTMTLICSEFQAIHVYEGTTMKWSAKLDFLPVSVNLFDTSHLHGLIVLLSDSGMVQVVYLGTIPSLYLIPPTTEPDINVVEAEEELKRLHLEITETDIGGRMDDILTLKLIVDPKVSIENDKFMAQVTMELSTLTPLNNVQVNVVTEPPLTSTTNSTAVASIVDKETLISKIYAENDPVVSGLEIKVVVSYFTPNGTPRVLEETGYVPFEVAMVPCLAAKDSPVKLTIVTNKPTCALNELFPGDEGSANAVGLKFVNKESAITVVAAKTSQRYRIQGETLEDLALVLETLVKRLNSRFRKIGDFNLTFGGPLPMQTFFENVERHYELITRRRLKQEQLAQRATQYRTIQKKVLASLKDLAPKPSGALYKVLDDTYNMLKTVIADLEKLEKELLMSRCRLSALSRLMLSLLHLMTLTKADIDCLKLVFNPIIHDGDEQGWLEVQNATLSLLIRTTFAKSTKDQNKPGEWTMEPLSDVSRLCKLFTTVVDRATKGASLMERAEFDAERESLPTMPSIKNWEEKESKLMPKSSKFTDLNVPIPLKLPPTIKEPERNLLKTEVIIEKAQPEFEVAPDVPLETTPSQNKTQLEELIIYPTPPAVVAKTEKFSDPKVKLQTTAEVTEDDAIWDINIDEMSI